jgi:stage V sporulation protein AD
MASKRWGAQSIRFQNPPVILSHAAIVGKKEGEGPLGPFFDRVEADDTLGQKSWEKAESLLVENAVTMAVQKAGLEVNDIDLLLGGDLLNQIVSASFAARQLQMPYLGLYGACSTMAESLLVGACMVDGGFAATAACVTVSHFSTAERQYRFPLELGSTRSPTAQWTVTGSGATLLGESGTGLVVAGATPGKVRDYGIKDAANMGAAMAPAAADTLVAHFQDTGRQPSDYDLVLTGDLGIVGKELLIELMEQSGYQIKEQLMDCGCEIFTSDQDVHAGGSGCGCAASVLNGWVLPRMEQGAYRRILFMATGALLSPITTQQGETIPGIAHAVIIERGDL